MKITPCNFDGLICPYGCPPGTKIIEQEHRTTLVGWFPMDPERDPNHHTLTCTCGACNKQFTKQYVIADKSAWYVDLEGFVLLGKPTCCDSNYVYTCEKCSGEVVHSTYKKGQSFDSLSGGVPMQPMRFECRVCGARYPDNRYGTKYMDAPTRSLR